MSASLPAPTQPPTGGPAVASSGATSFVSPSPLRVRVFVDFWNLQLTLNEHEFDETGEGTFFLDWQRFPKAMVAAAQELLGTPAAYEGAIVYTSYDPLSEGSKKHHRWATNWLDRQPGIQVKCRERHKKHPPKCRHCHCVIENCPTCNGSMTGTVEKGVDTAIVTDMIRMAWDKAYDVAVLVSSDADLVPAVQFLDERSFKVIQAGFPPQGMHLSTACWAQFDLFAKAAEFRRG